MKIIGVMTLLAMLIHILDFIQQMIIKMVDEREVQMVSVVPGVEKMNIDILSDNYGKKGFHPCYLILVIVDDGMVLSEWMTAARIRSWYLCTSY